MSPTAAARAQKRTRFTPAGADAVRGGQLLRWAREHIGWTQHEVARWIGVSREVVYNWEKGKDSPTEAHLAALADLYALDRLTLALLFGRDPRKVQGIGMRRVYGLDPKHTIKVADDALAAAMDHRLSGEPRAAALACRQAAEDLAVAIAQAPRHAALYLAKQAWLYYHEGSYKRLYTPRPELLDDTDWLFRRLEDIAEKCLDDRSIQALPHLLYGHTHSALGNAIAGYTHLEQALKFPMSADMRLGALGALAFCAGKLGLSQRVAAANVSLDRVIERGNYDHAPNVALALLGKAGGYGILAEVGDGPRATWASTSERAFDQALDSAPALLGDPSSPHILALQAACVRLDIAHAAGNWALCLELCEAVLDRADVYRHARYRDEITERQQHYDSIPKKR